jgi:hypothetical protein
MGFVRNAQSVVTRVVRWGSVAAVLITFSFVSHAQTSSGGFSEPTSTNTVLGSILQPAYNAGIAAGAGQVFGACASLSQQLQAAASGSGSTDGGSVLSSVLQSKNPLSSPSGGPQGNADPCKNSVDPGDLTGKSCTDYNYDPKQIQAAIDQVQNSQKAIACQRGRLDIIKQELSCLSEQGNTLTQQIASLQQQYTTNIQAAQQGVQKYQQVEQDRADQITQTNQILNGDPNGTGKQGLRGEMQALQSYSQGLQQATTNISARVASLAEAKTEFQQEVQIEKAAQMSQCLQTPVAGLYCIHPGSPGSVAVSPAAYIACMYGYSMQGTAVNPSAQVQESVSEAQNQAQSIIQSILGNMPSNGTLPVQDPNNPNSNTAADQFLSQNIGILTPSDLFSPSNSTNSSLLAQLDGLGPQYAAVFQTYLNNCYAQASNSTDPTVDPSTGQYRYSNPNLEQALLGLNNATSQLQSDVNTMVTQYQTNTEAAWAALTGKQYVPDVSQCMGIARNQAACVSSISSAVNDLMYGQTTASAATIQISSRIPGQAVTTQCQGVQGCITQMESLSTFLTNDKNAVQAAKTAYIQQANQQIEQFTTTMARAFSPAAQSLTDQLKSINLALGTLGVSSGVSIQKLQNPETLTMGTPADGDTNALYQMPKSALNLIGGATSPQMLDIANEDFSSSTSGINDAESKLGTDDSSASADMSTLQGLLGSCPAKKLAQAKDKISGQISAINSQCAVAGGYLSDPSFCSGGKLNAGLKSAIDTFNAAWSALDTGDGSDSGDSSGDSSDDNANSMNSLSTGVGISYMTCPTAGSPQLTSVSSSVGNSGQCTSEVSNLNQKLQTLQSQANPTTAGDAQ